MTDPRHIRREDPAPGIARVVLARADKRNAQDSVMLQQLDTELVRASMDDDVKVIILAADGPDFSSGHDLTGSFDYPERPMATMGGHASLGGAEGQYAFECEMYLGLSRRWRDLPKPVIVATQGRTIAGGIMLQWPFDIIVASEEATFSDPVVAFGVNGVEYFAHVWELGRRRAAEFLFTGEAITAAEAKAAGMVNHVVPLEELEAFTLAIAEKIALRPAFGLRLAKESINRSLDAQGQSVALDAALALHNLGHAAALARYGYPVVVEGKDVIRDLARKG